MAMRFLFSLIFIPLFLLCNTAQAQYGCTDPAALNYNNAATANDGSCMYPVTHAGIPLRCAIGGPVPECSGLAWSDGKLWTHNDSGNPADFYSIDTATGAVLQTVHVDNFPNTDWEDIAADSAFIYLGDFGNNHGIRKDLKILKIAKSAIGNAATAHVMADSIGFYYTDQTSFVSGNTHNFDCESLISIDDSLYIFTKDRGDYKSRVYRLPKTPGRYAVSPVDSFAAGGLVTGAAYNPATKNVLLVGYLLDKTHSFLWQLSNFQNHHFFSGNKRRIEIGGGGTWQTEGVAFISDDRFWVSCEATSPNPSALYTGNKNWPVATGVSNEEEATVTAYPEPVKDFLYLKNIVSGAQYQMVNAAGQTILRGTITGNPATLFMKNISRGVYLLILSRKDANIEKIRVSKL